MRSLTVIGIALFAVACNSMSGTNSPPAARDANPLTAEWAGPYGGVPPFDRMELELFAPALEAGMAAHLAEIDAIAANPEPATFENTIVAMEKAGRMLNRVMTLWGICGGNLSTPEFREVQVEMVPKIAEYRSKITQNADLFARIKAVYEADDSGRPADEQRVIWLTYNRFAKNGAELSGAKKVRYAEIQKRLAELHTKFSNNLLHDEENYVKYLTRSQLGGLSDGFVAAASAAAKSRGREGEYAITNTRSSMDPFLTYSTERGIREVVWRNYYSRGDNHDEYDNNALIAEILKLRHERVQLLGFDNYAQWQLQDRMAKTPEEVLALMEAIWPAAIARVAEEVADMQAIADAEGAGITIAPWDYRFYAEKVRQAKYDLDSDEVKQYLQLGKLRNAMFYVAGQLFHFEFTPVPEGSVPVFHSDVKVWEVTDSRTGAHVGLWYLDPFARTGKRSGAWASMYRGRSTFDGEKTVLSSNNSNFVAGRPGEPVLISWDDALTFFHEFGHALHYLSADIKYPTLNGGVRDYTELQSQLLEHWLLTDEVVNGYFTHVETGKPMPAALVAKIKKAATFNQGFSTTEYLASALMDMRYHMTDPADLDPVEFEKAELAKLGMPAELPMRHRSPHFAHVFSGEGYAAGYYGYLWADVLTSDAALAFREAPGGYYDEKLAKQLVRYLFAPRNAIDPVEAYRLFRGRDATIEPLMRDRGFPVPASSGQ